MPRSYGSYASLDVLMCPARGRVYVWGAQLRVAWTVFADAFHAEAREVKLTCRPFSVASFLSCLNNSEFVAFRDDAMLPAPAAVQIAATDVT